MADNEQYQWMIFSNELKRKAAFKGDFIARLLVRIVGRYLASPCLDIGTGSGALVRALNDKGIQAIGMDLVCSYPQVICGSITAIPFANKTFRTAFCCDVLEHLTESQLQAAMPEIARILTKDGTLVITAPNNEYLQANMVTCPQCGHQFHRYGHMQSFSVERLNALVQHFGFRPAFCRIYALGAMAKVPFGSSMNWLFKRLQFEFVGRSIVLVATRTG